MPAGVGHALIAAVETVLRQARSGSTLIRVLDGTDDAATFYERHGWFEDGTAKLDERQTMTLLEQRRIKPHT